MLQRHISLSIASLAIVLFTSTTFAASFNNISKIGADDKLTLSIVNNTPYTLTFEGAKYANNVLRFDLTKRVITPGNTAYFYGKAFVSPQIIDGLGGTIQFLITGKKNGKALSKQEGFIIGDTAIGWAHMPFFGFGQDSYLHTHISKTTIKQDPKSYDLAVKSGTITISDA